jgi:hypothetical protein
MQEGSGSRRCSRIDSREVKSGAVSTRGEGAKAGREFLFAIASGGPVPLLPDDNSRSPR